MAPKPGVQRGDLDMTSSPVGHFLASKEQFPCCGVDTESMKLEDL